MNKMPLLRTSQEIELTLNFATSKPPIVNQCPQQLPLSIEGLSQLLRRSDDDSQKDFGYSMEWSVGKTPFDLYCGEHDPQGMIQHAIAALQIGHNFLWENPDFRQDDRVAFRINNLGLFEVSPSHRAEEIEVYLHAETAHMEILLPSPDLWQSLGLEWLLSPPASDESAKLATYMSNNPIAHGKRPFSSGGRYTSWHAAVKHAGLAFE